MWRRIAEKLKNYPARLSIIRVMIEYGIGVTEDGRIVIGPVEIPEVSIARAAGVDRRIVRKTVEYILQDEELR
ncbi:MAG: amino acid-binding protein, partial [Nitrososphaerota archaeon]